MSSSSRDNNRTWPLVLALVGLLAICLLALAVRWELLTAADICGLGSGGSNATAAPTGPAPASIATATLQNHQGDSNNADQLFRSAAAHCELPELYQLGHAAKRVDYEPLTANDLPLSPPLSLEEDHYQPSDSTPTTDADNLAEPAPAHSELFDWQQAVLAPPPTLATIWSEPHLLLSRLEQLPLRQEVIAWRSDVQLAVRELLSASSLRSTTATAAIDRLETLWRETSALETMLPPTMDRYRMHATADTLRRNTLIWRATQQAAIASRDAQFAESQSAEPKAQSMLQKLDRIEAEIDQQANADSWRSFLQLPRLWQVARSGETSDPSARMNIAVQLLERLDRVKLDAQQQAVLAEPHFQALQEELRLWAYQPTHYESLLFELQRYEAVGRQQEAERILEMTKLLARSPHVTDRQLAATIEQEYRGAGLRMAVTEKLLNRFLPPPTQMQQPVSDRIRGATVSGQSNVTTGLSIRLLPDAQRLQMGLEARGEVTSDTIARKGPAAFRSTGRGKFFASKLLQHDGQRLFVRQSDVSTSVNNQLAEFETDYDSVPLINMFARSMALQQHDEEAPLAKREVEAKLRQQLRQRFDEQINTHLLTAEEQLQQKVLQPLRKLSLEPSMTGVRTTETRLISHYRLASDTQLTAAHTRIWAPSASLLSVQLHQSTVNNIINQLNLADRRLSLRELYEELAVTFNFDPAAIPDDLPQDVTIQFAPREPIRVDFHENTVSLTLHISELTGGDRRFHNFTVRAHYEPESADLNARLFRRSYVELIGQRLSFGDQIALRGVFSKTFAKQRPIALLDERLTQHAAFKSLALIQFQVEYGWLALAIGREGDAVVGQVVTEVAKEQGRDLR